MKTQSPYSLLKTDQTSAKILKGCTHHTDRELLLNVFYIIKFNVCIMETDRASIALPSQKNGFLKMVTCHFWHFIRTLLFLGLLL